ncbi:hypothetical protein IVB03_39465 [Bradyrhizobium sp. 168]|uniref:hypothetical protein n=1 Tax=Bradyrhizobium sp. 168 TaxID=2782639 RepID=UPI001FFC0589|nr:hypothetical protein [Bradyrhizobium sp. 168]MCK1585475.1 hypothetical protein [Bradyrhizobium sp. 168]
MIPQIFISVFLLSAWAAAGAYVGWYVAKWALGFAEQFIEAAITAYYRRRGSA